MIEKIKKNKFIIGIIVISLIYFILVSVQNPIFGYAGADDDYFIVHATKSILDFHWMGGFQGHTLSKGPGAPIFIAMANLVGITFTQSIFLLYIFSCILFINSIKSVIKNVWVRLIVFACILFNPVMYSNSLLVIYRDSINTSFLLCVIACAFGIFFNYKESFKKILPYMIGLGIFTAWMAITREETIWITPFVIGGSVITILFIIFDKNCSEKKQKLLLYLIPICIYIFTILLVCTLNKIAYGQFVRIEQNTKSYKEFLKAISSVDVEEPELTVPVPKEAREKLYEVSPTFSKLKDTFDGPSGNNLSQYGRNPNEIETGWLMWTIFAALNEHGYSQNLNTFNDFLDKATKEINEAYDDGRLKKEDNPDTIFDKENFNKLLNSINETFKYQLELKDVNIVFPEDTFFEDEHDPNITEERRDEFVEVTGNSSTNSFTYNYKVDEIKIKSLEKILDIYTFLNKPLLYISLAIYVLIVIRFFFVKPRFGNYKELIILTSLLMLQVIRIIVVAYVDTAMCPAINVLYLSSTYGLQFLFNVLSIIFGITGIINFSKKLRKKV